MIKFLNFKENFPGINTERSLEESDFVFVLELLDDLAFEDLFYLTCVEEEDSFELFNFIEANGELKEESADLQLYFFDDKNVVLFNTFDQTIIFCKRVDAEEFEEVF